MAEEARLSKITPCVSSFVLKEKQGSSFGLKFLVLYERGEGFLSPYPASPFFQLTEDLFILGGVPVFSLPDTKPKLFKFSVMPSALLSPYLPAFICLAPT